MDLLVKPAPLSRRELADLKSRFERRSALEIQHLEDIGAYASLTTCRRAKLLSHFGDEAARLVAPCDKLRHKPHDTEVPRGWREAADTSARGRRSARTGPKRGDATFLRPHECAARGERLAGASSASSQASPSSVRREIKLGRSPCNSRISRGFQ